MANAGSVKSAQPAVSSAASQHAVAIRSAMLSDPGRIRSENQDFCAAAPELGTYVLCDGMGGAAAGEVASTIATESFLHSLTQADTSDSPQRRLEQAVRTANLAVFQRAQKYRALRGMGTTLVAALIEPSSHACIAHVGDSRCYLLRANQLRQLTTDHSLVEEHIRAGLLDRQHAELSPVRNVITRAVGTQLTVVPDVIEQPLERGDLLLLASDGLTRELSDDDIAGILAERRADLDACCAALVAAANAHGGRDNITVVLIAVD